MPQVTQLARAEQGLKQGVSASEVLLMSSFYCLPEQVQLAHAAAMGVPG